jgi:hypothetical protein
MEKCVFERAAGGGVAAPRARVERAWGVTARGVAASVLAVLAADPAPVAACGGFFCSSAPVDQAGETIVYSLESDGTITMTVEVDYRGMDDDFAWILPVPAVPELSIGSPALFDALRRATDPIFYTEDVVRGVCRTQPRCVHSSGCGEVYTGGCGMSSAPSAPWMGGYIEVDASPRITGSEPDAGPPAPVTIYSDERVGPYDAVVLGASTAAEVVTWLQDHDYDIPATATELLEPYAAAGQVFIALRLSANAATGVLRPITLRMTTAEACLPIRLTAIATVPNMPITAFFLGAQPVAPTNYSTAYVEANDIGFFTGERSYADEVRAEIDRLDGHAFAVDYAGPTPAVRIELPSVETLASETDPARFLMRLRGAGYVGDTLLLELLVRHMPPPEGMEPQAYYNCLNVSDTASCGAPARFDPDALAHAIETEIREPRARAQKMVRRHPQLTRLYTEMSAEDMTLDPIFAEERRVPATSNVHVAYRVTRCSPDYFQDQAPRHMEYGDQIVQLSPGTRADDRAFCARFGGVPEGEAPRCEARETGGCSYCSGGGRAFPAGVGFAVLLALLVRRAIRRRSFTR